MDFWLEYFTMDELNKIKFNIHNNDIIKIFNNHITSIRFTEKIEYTYDKHTNIKIIKNTNEYQRISFIILLLIGIVTKKLEKKKSNIIIKGGRAIQLLLNNTIHTYISDDIDIIVNDKVSKDNKFFSYQFLNLIYWMLNQTVDYNGYLSFMETINIIKISHKTNYYTSPIYTALIDINFLDTVDKRFTQYTTTKIYDSIFGELHYKHQVLSNIIYEKLYYLWFYKNELKLHFYNPYYYNYLLFIINKFKNQISMLTSIEIRNSIVINRIRSKERQIICLKVLLSINQMEEELVEFILN